MPSECDHDIRSLRAFAADGPLCCAPESRELVEASLSVAEVRTDEANLSRLVKRGQRNEARDDVCSALVLACGQVAKMPKRPRRGPYHGTT